MNDGWSEVESLLLPLAIMLELFGAAIFINFVRVHFSLRTLLITMMFVAVALGIVGYILQK